MIEYDFKLNLFSLVLITKKKNNDNNTQVIYSVYYVC